MLAMVLLLADRQVPPFFHVENLLGVRLERDAFNEYASSAIRYCPIFHYDIVS